MKHLLIVDDQPHIVRVVRLTMQRQGYSVDTARDGLEALEKLRENCPDVIISDLQMPRMDGRQLCETLSRELPDCQPLVIIMTAKTDRDIRQWAETMQRTEFVEKPVSLKRLTSRLESYFSADKVTADAEVRRA